jgi:hypothetical protein
MEECRNRILDSPGRRGAMSMRKACNAAQFSSSPSSGTLSPSIRYPI